MKKINVLFFLLILLTGLITSCKKDDPGGIIIDDDSTAIADLMLEYPVEITMSETAYEGAQVDVDLDAIAALFEITREELLSAIAGEDGAPEITLYGLGGEGTPDVEVSSAANTNGNWGHWWDANGVNCEWGDDAMVFAEFFAENEYFAIGQYPGHLVDGQIVEFYECVKYNDLKAACHFTVTAKAPEEIVATIVNTQNLSIEIPARATYDLDSVEFDLSQTYTDLGISSMDEATLIAVKEDGSYAQEKSADNGYWIDRNGHASTWGNGGVIYTDYGGSLSDNMLGIGQFPDSLSSGETFTAYMGFLANDKIEMLEIAITVTDPVELVATVVNTQSLSISVDTIGDYSTDSLAFDMAQTLTDLGIGSMSEIESVVTYDLDGKITNVTATDNVFWYDLDGKYGAWGETASLFVNYGEYSEDEVSIGQYPDNLATMVGNTYTVNYGFLANEKVEMLEISVTVTAAQ